MSDYLTGGTRHPGGRRVIAILGVLLGLTLIVTGGTLLTAQTPTFQASRIPLVGRTTTICICDGAGGRRDRHRDGHGRGHAVRPRAAAGD